MCQEYIAISTCQDHLAISVSGSPCHISDQSGITHNEILINRSEMHRYGKVIGSDVHHSSTSDPMLSPNNEHEKMSRLVYYIHF